LGAGNPLGVLGGTTGCFPNAGISGGGNGGRSDGDGGGGSSSGNTSDEDAPSWMPANTSVVRRGKDISVDPGSDSDAGEDSDANDSSDGEGEGGMGGMYDEDDDAAAGMATLYSNPTHYKPKTHLTPITHNLNAKP
jgi:hypothetical protein